MIGTERKRESVVCEYVLAEGRRSAGINIYEKKRNKIKLCVRTIERRRRRRYWRNKRNRGVTQSFRSSQTYFPFYWNILKFEIPFAGRKERRGGNKKQVKRETSCSFFIFIFHFFE
jgi:hypothetical protein